MGSCFVIMGFGEKTDFQSSPQRVLNLNRTYANIIKPAVTAAGLKCVRADEITHSGPIDVPMYEQLLNADVVIGISGTSTRDRISARHSRHAPVRIPAARARSPARRMTGPSARGSEKGKPISSKSAPPSTAASASWGVSGPAMR